MCDGRRKEVASRAGGWEKDSEMRATPGNFEAQAAALPSTGRLRTSVKYIQISDTQTTP